MANTLTAVLPNIYEALYQVPRELIGIMRGVYMNTSLNRAAYNQTITYPIIPAMSTADITPSNVSSSGTDQTITAGSMVLDNRKKVPWTWQGEEIQALNTGDAPQGQDIRTKQFLQAFRTLGNAVESSVWTAAYKGASRAYGTAGTTPFSTAGDLSDFAGARQILDENGAPQMDLHLGIGHTAVSKLRGVQSVLFKANEAGTDDLLRRGVIGEVEGFQVHGSHPIVSVTKGTGSGYLVNNGAGYAVGDTAITVDTGTGTILAGDVVTFAGDSNKYVVATALASNVVTLAAPGLRATLADNVALTVGNSAVKNVAFNTDAVHLVARPPAVPEGGDSADDRITVQDQVSGLMFDIATYRQYYQLTIEVALVWGVEVVNPEFVAQLLG